MRKRIFSAALAGCMMLTMVPVTAFAAEEGATEVSIEQYAAEPARLERIKFTDDYKPTVTDSAEAVNWGLSKFQEDDTSKTLKPVVNYEQFSKGSTAGKVAIQSGYYLPLQLIIPGMKDTTQVIVRDCIPVNYDDPYAAKDDTDLISIGSFDWQTESTLRNDTLDILIHVARLDGVLKRTTVEADVYLDGITETEEKDVQHVVFDLAKEGVTLKPSKYMGYMAKEELEVCTDAKKDFYGKKATDLYDASTKTVKKVTGYTGFSSVSDEQSGYYLPFWFDLDANTNAKIKIRGKNVDGSYTSPVEELYDAETIGGNRLVVQIAELDGKMKYDEIEVTIYPEKDDSKLLSKTLTFDLSNVKLAEEEVSMTARLPEASKVTGDNYLEYRHNLAAVKGVVFKDNVLTITADLSSVVEVAAESNKANIPVLFTMTRDGKSIVQAQPDVKNYGGTSLTDFVLKIDLREDMSSGAVEKNIPDTAGVGHPIKFKIVNASRVPVLDDSTVKVENSTMTGMTAEAEAKTAADFKAMYKENGGTVTITTSAGVTMKDDAAVGTGCLIVLKDRDGNVVDTITVVVKGDVLGDGYAHAGQLVALGKAALGVEPLEGVFLEAGNFNDAPGIDPGDIVAVGKLVLAALN